MVDFKSFVLIIFCFYPQTFINGQFPIGNLVANLSPTDQANFLNQMNSGNLNDFVEKTQNDLLAKLNEIYNRLNNLPTATTGNISLTDQNFLNSAKQTLGNLINKIKTVKNITQLMSVISSINASSSQITSLPSLIRNAIMNSSFSDYFDLNRLGNPINSNMINFDNSKPSDISEISSFWNTLSSMNSNFLQVITDQKLNSSQLIALQMLIEIPPTDQRKKDLMYNIMDLIQNRYPYFISDLCFINQNNNSRINSSQIILLQKILKYFSCNLLKKIVFDDVKTVLMQGDVPFDLQTFEKIVRCNPKVLLDAVNFYRTDLTTTNQNVNSVLASLYYDYEISLNMNAAYIVQSLGYLIRFLPSNKIDSLFMKANTSFVDLFKMLNLKDYYEDLPDEMRRILAKYATMYFMQLNKTLTADDINVLGITLPDMNPDNLLPFFIANQNYRTVLAAASATYVSTWIDRCDLALRYVKIITKAIIFYNDTSISLENLKPLLICKNDCDFRDFKFLFLNNSFSVARSIIEGLKNDVAPLCQMTIGKYLRPTNGSNITAAYLQSLGRVPLLAVFTQREISQMDPSILINNIGLIANTTTNKELAMKLRSQTANLPLDRVGGLIVGQSMDYFLNKTPAEVKSSISTVINYIDELSSPIKTQLIQKYFQNATKQDLIFLASKIGKKTANIIPLDYCKQVQLSLSDITNGNDMQLPDSCLRYIATKTFSNKTFRDLAPSDYENFSKIAPYIPTSVFKNLTVDNPINLITALLSEKQSLNSYTRRMIYSYLINTLKQDSGDTPNLYLTKLTDSLINQLEGDLFIEMTHLIVNIFLSEAELIEFIKLPQFMTALNMVSKIPSDRCCNFPLKAKQRFAIYAIKAMGKENSKLTRDDLDTLGMVLVSSFNFNMISNIDLQELAERLSYFQGFCLQLNKADSSLFSTLLGQLASIPKYNNDLDSLLLDLGDLVVYYPNFSMLNSSSLINMIANVKLARNNKNTGSERSTRCRPVAFVADDNNDLKNRFTNLDKVVINLMNKMKTQDTAMIGRKKRQTTSAYTCDDLQTMGASISLLDVTTLQSISVSEIMKCLILLGNITTWGGEQAVALANIIKSNYNSNAANIPDAIIGQMRYINLGFDASDLSLLVINTTDTISLLGVIPRWSLSQLNTLAPSIKSKFGLSSNILMAMNNLICGLSSSDVMTVTSNDFKNALPVLSQVSICIDMSSWFTLAIQVYPNLLSSADLITQAGTILSGMNISLFQSLSQDQISVIPPFALASFPVSTLNKLSDNQISALSLEQIQDVLNSPNGQLLSVPVRASLDKQANIDPTISKNGASKLFKFGFGFNLIYFAFSIIYILKLFN